MTSHEYGFSAVELLITLFIAAIFLTGGYQLWIYSQKSGVESQRQAEASNVAYKYLRQAAAAETGNCSPSSNTTSVTDGSLSNASVKITTSCPYGDTSDVSKITSTITYGSSGEQVSHALFAS